MAKSNGGALYPNPHNETGSGDANSPDTKGDDLYFNGWTEINKMHLAETGDMTETPNSKASRDVYGGPAAGEANPAGMGGHGGGKSGGK